MSDRKRNDNDEKNEEKEIYCSLQWVEMIFPMMKIEIEDLGNRYPSNDRLMMVGPQMSQLMED